MIGAALFYSYAFGKFFNGFLSDHFRPRLFFSASIFVAAVVNLFMGFTTFVWVAVVLWALNGWFQGMAAPSAVISITNWFGLHERGRRYGLWNASHSIGEGLTFYVIAAIVSAWGWRYGFITPGILCIAVAIWVYSFLQDAPTTIGLPDVHDWLGEETELDKQKTTWQTQKVVFGIKAMWIVAISSGLMYITRYAINSWGVLYLQETRGFSLVEAGLFLGINTAAGIVGSIAYGYLSDKVFDARSSQRNRTHDRVCPLRCGVERPRSINRWPVRCRYCAARRRRCRDGFRRRIQLPCRGNAGERQCCANQSWRDFRRRHTDLRFRYRHHVLDRIVRAVAVARRHVVEHKD
jgi:OPA family sugar phosphate sensor protein UhpC-like MFS transporter